MTFTEFIQNYLDKRVDSGVFDKSFQCVDLIRVYGEQVWGILAKSVGYSGGAKDMLKWNSTFRENDVDRISNTPNGVPPKGAIIVFDGSWLNKWGHTGVVVDADINRITVLEQNGGLGKGFGFGNDRIRYNKYKYTWNSAGVGKVLGWIIPKNGKLTNE